MVPAAASRAPRAAPPGPRRHGRGARRRRGQGPGVPGVTAPRRRGGSPSTALRAVIRTARIRSTSTHPVDARRRPSRRPAAPSAGAAGTVTARQHRRRVPRAADRQQPAGSPSAAPPRRPGRGDRRRPRHRPARDACHRPPTPCTARTFRTGLPCEPARAGACRAGDRPPWPRDLGRPGPARHSGAAAAPIARALSAPMPAGAATGPPPPRRLPPRSPGTTPRPPAAPGGARRLRRSGPSPRAARCPAHRCGMARPGQRHRSPRRGRPGAPARAFCRARAGPGRPARAARWRDRSGGAIGSASSPEEAAATRPPNALSLRPSTPRTRETTAAPGPPAHRREPQAATLDAGRSAPRRRRRSRHHRPAQAKGQGATAAARGRRGRASLAIPSRRRNPPLAPVRGRLVA